MQLYARQGDLVFEKTNAVTGKLTDGANLVLAGDDAPHTVKGKVQYRKDGRITFLRVAKKTTVQHAGRHLPIPLVPGDYRVSPLRERGDRDVED